MCRAEEVGLSWQNTRPSSGTPLAARSHPQTRDRHPKDNRKSCRIGQSPRDAQCLDLFSARITWGPGIKRRVRKIRRKIRCQFRFPASWQQSELTPDFPDFTRSQAPSLRRHYPAATVLRACPPPLGGPACPARTSGWQEFPRHRWGFPCASFTLKVSRPAQRSLTLRPAGSRDRLAVLGSEGFGDLVTSSAAPIATGWSESCRAGIAPAEERRLVTAHSDTVFRSIIGTPFEVSRPRYPICPDHGVNVGKCWHRTRGEV